MSEPFYNAAVRLRRGVLSWIAVAAIVGVGAAAGQEAGTPAIELPAEAAEPLPAGSSSQSAIDRLETVLAILQSQELAWLEQDKAQRDEAQARREQIAVLEADFAATERRTAEVDDLHRQVNPLLLWAIDEARGALERAYRPSELPAWLDRLDEVSVSPFGGGSGDEPPGTEATEQLEDLLDQLREKGERLREFELELRLADVERDIDVASRIYRLRLAILKALTFERRAQVYGWGGGGREAVRLESEAVELAVRIQWFRLRGSLASAALKLRGLLSALLAGRILVRLLILVLIWRWAQRGRQRSLQSLRRRAERLGDPQRQRWATGMVDFAEALAPWGIFILGAISIGWVFDSEVEEIPFLAGAVAVFVAYGIYRLGTDLLTGAFAAAMDSAGLDLTDDLRRKLHSGVRWVVRAAAPVAFVLWLYAYRLGGGVLYAKIRTAGIVFVLVVLLTVVTWFRHEIREMFLAVRAHGRLADLVRKTAGKWTANLVTPIAFVWLCGRGLLGLFRGITHSFERTRTATAYLSRRRMLKVAEQRGSAAGVLENLPAALVEALDEQLTVEDAELLGGFAGLETARASATTWREGGIGGSLLLAGEDGLGKEAWLASFLELEGDGIRLQIEDRMISPAKLRSWLAQGLLPDGGGTMSQSELIEAICSGPRRIVVIEGADNLFLTTVNGYRALAELGPIVDGTRKQVFWLLTMKGLAWNHLRAAGKELAFLRRKVVMQPRSEEQIEALIDSRLANCGLQVSYADLMAVEGRKEDEIARNRLGKQTFMNLLWGFSGGNPRIALHFFLRSLEVAADGSLKAWPFAAPAEDELTEIGDEPLFLLAAVMRHGALNVRQAATTTAYPVGRVEGHFLQLLDLGVVTEDDGTYRVTTRWRATVLRVLRRRNILVS